MGHGVERLLQRGHLVLGSYLNAIGQVAAVHMLGCNVEIGHRFGDAAGEPHTDEQRYQLDKTKKDCDAHQAIEEDLGFIAEGIEQSGVSIEGRGSTRIKPVMDLPVYQSMALKRVANGMCTSNRLVGGGTCPASTLELAFSPDRLTISREFPVLKISLSLSLAGAGEDLEVRVEELDEVSGSCFVSSSGGSTVTDPSCDVAIRRRCGVTGTLEITVRWWVPEWTFDLT